MAHVISDECVSCGSCEGECPVGAISEGDGKYEIDADACVDCGACEAACQDALFHILKIAAVPSNLKSLPDTI